MRTISLPGPAPVTITRAEWEGGAFEVAQRPVHPLMRGLAKELMGYEEVTPGEMARMEVPYDGVTFILLLEAPISVRNSDGHEERPTHGFIAGLYDTWVTTTTDRIGRGVQVNLTPFGAHMLTGLPMSELANRVVDFEDLFGPDGAALAERTYAAKTWDERLCLVETALATRMAEREPPPPAVRRAWSRLRTTAGSVGIQALADEVGWSRKHLVEGFRQHVGLPPKTMARVFRFQRALQTVEQARSVRWTDVAADCGYYDQAHLIRDFREFTGSPPTEFLGRRIQEAPGYRAD